ncbi:MAG: hypothetical protein IT294_14880 [Deltaproteobacteria bacterium]|nr:hypothetical protein [Deltaproteobacteria bacterium]
MSLKYIHVVFIAAATALSVVFGTWCWAQWETAGGMGMLLGAGGSAAAAVGLLAYGRWFLVKTRGMGE